MKRRSFLTMLGSLPFIGWATKSEEKPIQTWAPSAEEELGKVLHVKNIYAKRGDLITCENGHPIATFERDVEVGDSFDATAIVAWQQTPPEIGTMEKPCEICGQRWFKGPYFHFWDGWRIAYDEIHN